MQNLEESHAKERLCPFMLTPMVIPGNPRIAVQDHFCQGSRCLAWKAHDANLNYGSCLRLAQKD